MVLSARPEASSPPGVPPAAVRTRAGRWRRRALVLVGLAALAAAVYGGARARAAWRAEQDWRQARAAVAAEDLAAARNHLDRYVAARPGAAEGRFLLARTCRRLGDHEAAWEHLEAARRLQYDEDELAVEVLML